MDLTIPGITCKEKLVELSIMNLTVRKFCENFRITKCVFSMRARVLPFGNINIQTRCKSITTRPKVIIKNKYERQNSDIGLYGYSLLASNVTNKYDYLQFIL